MTVHHSERAHSSGRQDLPINPKTGKRYPASCAYELDMCEKVVAMGAKGMTTAQMAVACDISLTQFNIYRKNFPEFADAVNKAITLQKAWLDQKGLDHLTYQDKLGQSMLNETVWKEFRTECKEDLTQAQSKGEEMDKEIAAQFTDLVNKIRGENV